MENKDDDDDDDLEVHNRHFCRWSVMKDGSCRTFVIDIRHKLIFLAFSDFSL